MPARILNLKKPRPSTDPSFKDLETAFSQFKSNNERDLTLDYYFDSYSHFGIHEEMIKDRIRTECYMRSIVNNEHLFKDKVVLDIGCGTGILSVFAARAGAKAVYGIDFAQIADRAKEIMDLNGYEDRVTIIRGKIEEIELPVEKVDIIISEWMGYFLLYEGMLDCVLFARDKWLADNGLIFPDKAVIKIAGIEDHKYLEGKNSFWDNVYGFKMTCMKEWAQREPLVDVINSQAIITRTQPVKEIDIYTIKKEDLDFSTDFVLNVTRTDTFNGIVAWFDTYFTESHKMEVLDTSPYADSTHWKQTMFYIKEPFLVNKGDKVEGRIIVRKNKKNPRQLDVFLSFKVFRHNQPRGLEGAVIREQFYTMS